jgi:hypothetical protein
MLLNHERFLQMMCTTTAHGDMEHHMANTASLTLTRHLGLRDTGGPDQLQTLGVGILFDDVLGVAYAFAFADGDPEFPADLRADVEQMYGRWDFQTNQIVSPGAVS